MESGAGREGALSASGPAPRLEPPTLELPAGGGAIRGIDERFSVSPPTGAARLAVPLPFSPGRSGATPALGLAYDTGNGNGPFGLGWRLSLPEIARKTDRGVPRYRDDGAGADLFALAGGEELVPALELRDGRLAPDVFVDDEGFEVTRYRQRIEGSFLRIERLREPGSGATHWLTTTPDNVRTVFGRRAESRLADPADPRRVARWLVDEVRDDRGNVATFEYKPEDSAGIGPAAARAGGLEGADGARYAGLYPKRVLYGNRRPFEPGDACFELVFDYGEHDPDDPTPGEVRAWPLRADPFTRCRLGFPERTQRLCRRLLMFHRFPELGPEPVLVRSLDLGYRESPRATLLVEIIQRGTLRRADGGLRTESLPAVTLSYTEATLAPAVGEIDAESAVNLPAGLADRRALFVDLDGEGLSGVLLDDDGEWLYKKSLGDGRFAAARPVASRPAAAAVSSGRERLLDLDGSGRLCVARFAQAPAGVHRQGERGWTGFAAFAELPNLDWSDPDLRFVDLTGDGRADLLRTTDEALLVHPSLGGDGFAAAETVRRAVDEADGPLLLFSDAAQSVFIADMNGDGLADLVRLRDGEVCYWPSLGHGRFGARVTMTGSPRFGPAESFRHDRVRLADVDGSGPADLLYLAADGVRLWHNQSGNGWSDAETIAGAPPAAEARGLEVVDLLGKGTACLVFSSELPGEEGRVRYLDLMAAGKPHLLATVDNGRGAAIAIEHVASTRYLLEDRRAGREWLTRLPFPVHVVARVETRDAVAGTRRVTTHRYRHGYYDGVERELGGFAFVETRDAESLAAESGRGRFTGTPESSEGELHLPPVVTRSWFHTGAFLGAERLEERLAEEYFHDPDAASPPPHAVLPAGLGPAEAREACRALRGSLLRQEIYGDDGRPEAAVPYATSHRSYALSIVQPRQAGRRAVLLPHARETLDTALERRTGDPRISHSLVLEVDALGFVTRSASIAYPRRAAAHPEQRRAWASCRESEYLHRPRERSWYRLGVVAETRVFELTGLPDAGVPLSFEAVAAAAAAPAIPFEAEPDGTPERRLLGRTRRLYQADDGSETLAFGTIESRALPDQSYTLASTPGLVARLFGGDVTEPLMAEAGYVRLAGEDGWWAPSGRSRFDPQRFFLPRTVVDPFGNETRLSYDPHGLAAVRVVDPLGNERRAELHYRVLAPWLVTDANANRSAVRFDALGRVAATFLLGKTGSDEGDLLDEASTEASPLDLPGSVVTYDLASVPVSAHARARESHRDPETRWSESRTYFDGSGRVAMTKALAEPETPGGPRRWVGSGRTVFDNKGNPVKQYEPYFSATADYESEAALVEQGVTALLRYDPLGRLRRTDLADGTFATVDLDPWLGVAADANDNVAASRWAAERAAGALGAAEEAALAGALAHDGTATRTHLDALGRVFLTEADAGAAGGVVRTRVVLDLQGNERALVDALGREAMAWDHDLLGQRLGSRSIDAGPRRSLPAVDGSPVRSWDSRGHRFRTTYDALRRPTATFVSREGAAERCLARITYGESLPEPEAANLRARVAEQRDGAGLARNEAFDFRGNLLVSSRRFLAEPDAEVDWSGEPGLEATAFRASVTWDALGRPVAESTPDGSVVRLAYNDGGFVETTVLARPGEPERSIVEGVVYDARGQRLRVDLGNGTATGYEYDPDTFRLRRLTTTRTADGRRLQDLRYTYDPVGNLTRVEDAAQPEVFFRNQAVAARGDYLYDPLYRLRRATGREHRLPADPTGWVDWDDRPRRALEHPHDGVAMRRWVEEYDYDPVGNLLETRHVADGGSWTRRRRYEASSNRLRASDRPGDPAGVFSEEFVHDAHGNMTALPHLPELAWDESDRLVAVDLGGGGRARYGYDGSGQRVRKRIVRDGGVEEERLTLGPFELFRRRLGGDQTLARETLHVAAGPQTVARVDLGTDLAAAQPVVVFQYTNHLGSACLELDEAGAVVSYEEFYPFGSTSLHTAAPGSDVSLKRYRHTGKERDEETGLDAFGARYYAPWLGRWTAADPAASGVNGYVYCSDSPVVRVDPDGRLDEVGWAVLTIGRAALGPVGLAIPEENREVQAFAQGVTNALADRGKAMVEAAPQLLEAADGLATMSHPLALATSLAFDPQKTADKVTTTGTTGAGMVVGVAMLPVHFAEQFKVLATLDPSDPAATYKAGYSSTEAGLTLADMVAVGEGAAGAASKLFPGVSRLFVGAPEASVAAEAGAGGAAKPPAVTSAPGGSAPKPTSAPKIHIDKFLQDLAQSKVTQAAEEFAADPAGVYTAHVPESVGRSVRFVEQGGGAAVEYLTKSLIEADPVGKLLLEHVPHETQIGGRGTAANPHRGDFRVQSPFQEAWGTKELDVTTPKEASSKMGKGREHTFLLYEVDWAAIKERLR